jgi:hypothetical protein
MKKMSDEERERLNHPDRFKTDDFVYEVKPDGELEDPRATAWRRERQGLPSSGISEETEEAKAEREESETIGNMNAEYEVSLPKPAHSAEYLFLKNEDPNFHAIREAMVLHCQSQPDGGVLGEEVNSNPAAFLKLYKEMARAAGGRLKAPPSLAGTYRGGVRVSDSPREPESDPEPSALSNKEVARLKTLIREGRTPRERQAAEEKLIAYYMPKGGR